MHDGWVKLHRQSLDTPELQDPLALGVWSTLIMRAAHVSKARTFRQQTVFVQRGEVLFSIHGEAQKWGIGHKKLRLILDKFAVSGMIKMDKAQGKAFSRISICNYNLYQVCDEAEGQSLGQSQGKARAKLGQTEQEREECKKESYTSPNGADRPAIDVSDQMVAAWNAELGDVLAKPRKLDRKRRVALNARFRSDFGSSLDEWTAYCRRIRRSPFLIGETARGGWRANLDFCLKEGNINRILEGSYDAGTHAGNGHMRSRHAAPRTSRDSSHAFTDLLNVGTTDEQS